MGFNNFIISGQFDFDAYLGHFAPMQHTVNDHPRFLPNQDYRYIPLLGERPDYIPPILHRGHIPHPNIPKREVKHRAWHSNYQNGNFPTPAIENAKKSIQSQNAMQTHKRELHQPVTDTSMPNSNFNFRIHSKMEDFGDYEAPVILETIEKEIPVFRQQNDDYDIPVVLESIIRKHTPNSIKQNHKKPVSAVPSKEKQVIKGLDSKKPIFISPSPDEDYEEPVVVEAVVKENPISKSPSHKMPENYPSNFAEDYDVPIVLEALSKVNPPIHNKRHGHKKPNKAKPVKQNGHTDSIIKPVDKLVSPSYQEEYEDPIALEEFTKKESAHIKGHDNKLKEKPSKKHDLTNPIVGHAKEQSHKNKGNTNPVTINQNEKVVIANPPGKPVVDSYFEDDYEAPIFLEEFTKKESAHIKGHDNKRVKEKPLKKQDVANPIVKPVVKKTVSSYSEDYESPLVIEEFHKEESHPNFVHTKEQGHKSKGDTKPITKKQEKVVISTPVEKPVVTSYTEDEYEEPIVLEALTKDELFHKEHGNKKSSVMKPEKPKVNESGKKVIGSKESIAEEYGYEELEHFTIHGEDEYDDSFVVGSEMQRNSGDYDSEDYNYEDSTIKDPTPKREHQTFKEHDHKSVIAQSSKIHPEIMNENYEKNSNVPSIDQGIYETSKEMPKSSVTKETKKRVKRETNVDYEDYELPIVLESIVKHPTVPKEHGIKTSGDVKSSESEQDYEAPVILESIVKGNNLVKEKPTRTKPAKVDKPKVEHLIDYYDYVEPVVLESIVKNTGLATGHKSAFEGPTDYDYETPIEIASFTKEELGHKPAVKSEIKKTPKPVENTPIVEKSDAYIRNKREREQHMEFPKLVNSIVRQDAYGRPIDELEKHGYELNAPQRPHDYFDEWESVPKGNPSKRNSGSLGNLDNQIVLDSITINREHPDGHEIPFLEVLAVENTDGGHENGVKVMSFNQENGDVDAFNIGHVDSNVDIAELGDQGSGSVVDERSVSRSFLPLDSNSWSFMNHVQAQERRKFKRCFTPKNETGNCMPVQMCPVPNAGNTVDDFLKNVCIIDEVFIGICCPEFPVETVRVDWGQFGSPDTEPLIDNEEESKEAKGKIHFRG